MWMVLILGACWGRVIMACVAPGSEVRSVWGIMFWTNNQ